MAASGLAKKLLIKPGQRITIINPPSGYLDQLGELPAGVELVGPDAGPCDVVQVFVKSVEELNSLYRQALSALKPSGVLWFCYPKQSSKVKTDLTRDVGWDEVNKAGYRPVSLFSIDEVWSAFRFRPYEQVGKK